MAKKPATKQVKKAVKKASRKSPVSGVLGSLVRKKPAGKKLAVRKSKAFKGVS